MKVYSYEISKEPLLSRLPALFAYIDYEANGNSAIHKATDSIDGCYGKVIENITYNGKTYTYRELINYYYEYKNTTEGDRDLIAFMDKGIGKKEISEEEYPRDIYELVPDYIYIATAQSQYDEMMKLKKLCDAYEAGINNGMESVQSICCDCEKYEKMGGDKMLSFLQACIQEANAVANEYYGYVSDDRLTLHFSINLNCTMNDLGLLTPYLDVWEGGKKYNVGDLVYYNYQTYVCIKENTGYWNNELDVILFPYNIDEEENCFELIKEALPDGAKEDILIGVDEVVTTDSKLKSLRRYKEYTDALGNTSYPDYGYDWLYYYRVGQVITYNTLNDDLGNIAFFTDKVDDEIIEGNTYTDLYAYGDIIDEINLEYNEDSNRYEIVFTYYIGCHFKATCSGKKYNDDGNLLYYFENFERDTEDGYHGVKYVDRYTVESDSEIITDFVINPDGHIIDTEKFNAYVRGDIESGNKKYEFATYIANQTHDKNINGSIVQITSIQSQISAKVKGEGDYEHNWLMGTDYYNGISYIPNTDVDVFIDRGSTAAIEKHIKLGEVKTLDDIILFANGSFFKIEDVTG